MTDTICRKTMQRCKTPGMCAPHGGCQDPVNAQLRAINFNYELHAHAADEEIARLKTENTDLHTTLQAAKGEIERLNVLLTRVVDQHVPLTDLEGAPGWSRVVELNEVVAKCDQLKAENEALRECVEDLALSLECEVKARYAGTQSHPALKRKYDGDMQEVIDARALLSKDSSHG